MEYAKKMALVEPRLLEGLPWQQQHFQTPLGKAMSSLDGDMQDILARHDVTADEKVKLYNQVLQRYVNFHDQRQLAAQAPMRVTMAGDDPRSSVDHTDTSPATTAMADAIEREMLDSVPPRMKKKAQLLINRIKAHPQLTWTDRGEMVYKDQVMANTNVSDLVNDVLRRRKHFEPHGWQTFARALKDTNVPQNLIGHHERWQWMQHPQEVPIASTAASPAAPLRKKKTRVVSTRVPRGVQRWSAY